jgi:hypothetical protein
MNITVEEAILLLKTLPPKSTFGVKSGSLVKLDFLPYATHLTEMNCGVLNLARRNEEEKFIKLITKAGQKVTRTSSIKQILAATARAMRSFKK